MPALFVLASTIAPLCIGETSQRQFSTCAIAPSSNDGWGHQMAAKMSCIALAHKYPDVFNYIHIPVGAHCLNRQPSHYTVCRANDMGRDHIEPIDGIMTGELALPLSQVIGAQHAPPPELMDCWAPLPKQCLPGSQLVGGRTENLSRSTNLLQEAINGRGSNLGAHTLNACFHVDLTPEFKRELRRLWNRNGG